MTAAGLLLVAGTLVGGAPGASAAKGGTCKGFTLTTGGKTYSGNRDFTIPPGDIGPTIRIAGKYVRFVVDSSTFAVRNYVLTGRDSPRPDKNLPLDAPTVVFRSKIPQHGATLTGGIDTRLDTSGDMRIERSSGGGTAGEEQKMKIQAKNCSQGGLFQMETEPGTTYRHRLGPDFHYNGLGPEGRLCLTNGDFPAYESPQRATLLAPRDGHGTTSRWRVQSGGRMGYVVGEDAQQGGCSK